MKSVIILVGVLWPFLIAGMVFAAQLARIDVTDSVVVVALLSMSSLGAPAITMCIYFLFPVEWNEQTRIIAAALLTVPFLVVEIFLAVLGLLMAMHYVGFVPA